MLLHLGPSVVTFRTFVTFRTWHLGPSPKCNKGPKCNAIVQSKLTWTLNLYLLQNSHEFNITSMYYWPIQ